MRRNGGARAEKNRALIMFADFPGIGTIVAYDFVRSAQMVVTSEMFSSSILILAKIRLVFL